MDANAAADFLGHSRERTVNRKSTC